MDAVCHRYGDLPSRRYGLVEPEDHLLAAAFDATVLSKAGAVEARQYEEMRGGKSHAEKDAAKRSRLLMWQGTAETAPEGSELKRQALAVVARLRGELGE